ncbi:hypothetical protein EYF80_014187 [Liparis tanakae]|uniref:Uncharacterized protein n=1 Tax=Liparis tanakae TaxID=230148 RepID=A0A4Z2ICK8_9TELE|nr:hypothetical protein EYF80_014187 [Liparis tanakae]
MDFIWETAIRRMVSLSGFRARALQVGTMSDSSVMYWREDTHPTPDLLLPPRPGTAPPILTWPPPTAPDIATVPGNSLPISGRHNTPLGSNTLSPQCRAAVGGGALLHHSFMKWV